ncbi:MAG: 3-hydroxyacyl-ACP dehydratase FabZ [Eubacteriales bacterium]
MNRDEIKKIIPHREPMLLVDEINLGEDGKAYGRYTVTGEEWFLMGHFPGNPIVPGVIQCEMAAQTCAAMLSGKIEGKTPFFTGINNVKFKKQVKPGDTIEFECEIEKFKIPFYFAKGKASVAGTLCMSGEFSFAII